MQHPDSTQPPQAKPPRERLWTAPFLACGLVNGLQGMAHFVMLTILPLVIIESFRKGDLEAGLAMACFQVGAVCFRPLAGCTIDRMDKQNLLRLTSLALMADVLLFLLWPPLEGIYALRLVHGVIFAFGTTTAAAAAALLIPPSRKGEGFGYFAVTINLAMIIGPLAGLTVYGAFGANAVFLFLGAICAIALLASLWPRLPSEARVPRAQGPFRLAPSSFFERKSLPASVFGGLVFFAYGAILTFVTLYARSLGLEQGVRLFFLLFAAVIVASRPLVGRLFDTRGPGFVVWPGFLLFGLGLLALGASGLPGIAGPGGVQVLPGLALSRESCFLASTLPLGLGFGALTPAFQTIAVTSAPRERAGVATATFSWLLDINVGLAAFALGLAATQAGYPRLYMGLAGFVGLEALAYGCWLWRRRA